MRKFALAALAGLLTTLALASVAGACTWTLYQPPVPKSLER